MAVSEIKLHFTMQDWGSSHSCGYEEIATKRYTGDLTWSDSLERPNRSQMGMTFGTWNISSLYSVGTLATVARVIEKYVLHQVRVQVIRWDRSGSEPACHYINYIH
jgi:hypothetical protein